MTERSLRLILLGPPGAGKGTQAAWLARELKIPYISTGEMFRAEAKAATPLGRQVSQYMRQGALVPDEVVIAVALKRLGQADTRQGFILDGFPRTTAQAEALDAAMTARQTPIALAIQVTADEAVIIKRLAGRRICGTCGANYHVVTMPPQASNRCDRCQGQLVQRPDDQPETIQRRLAVYRRDSEPLIDYYQRSGRLREVSGNGSIEACGRDLLRVLQDAGLAA